MIETNKKKLRVISRDTSTQEVADLLLIDRLRAQNKAAWTDGCGLAAIQIGVPLRFAWYKCNGKEGVLLNPVIIESWGSSTEKEGCLSIPNKYVMVTRAVTIKYRTGRKTKKAHGFLARLIQHEIDHMNGILNIDKAVK